MMRKNQKPDSKKIKVIINRVVALDKLLLEKGSKKIIERRQSQSVADSRDEIDGEYQSGRIIARRNTTKENAIKPTSILVKQATKNIPFALTGRRRKSVTFNEAIQHDNGSEDIVDLIDLGQSQIESNKTSSSDETNILKTIGFDGPIDDAVSIALCNPIEPNVESNDVPDKLIDSLVIRDMHGLPKRDYGRKRPPIPKLLPIRQPKRRLSIASKIILNVVNLKVLVTAVPADELLMSVDYNTDCSFGAIGY